MKVKTPQREGFENALIVVIVFCFLLCSWSVIFSVLLVQVYRIGNWDWRHGPFEMARFKMEMSIGMF